MGERARKVREETERTIRDAPLTDAQREFLRHHARYEGSPLHKKDPNNFGVDSAGEPAARQDLVR